MSSENEALAVDWFVDHANLITLTAYMADHGYEAKDIAYAVEKPWKFEDEFLAAQREVSGE
jgi:hypothetical protein